MRVTGRRNAPRGLPSDAGFTFVEIMVASAIGTVLLAVLLALTFYGEQSFTLMTSYSEMDGKSRAAIAALSEEIRSATQVTQAKTNLTGKTLILTNANDGLAVKLTWDSTAGTLTMQRLNATNSVVLLSGCTEWDYTLYDGAPVFKSGNVVFNPSLTLPTCRLIEMSWTCSRKVSGKIQATGVESIRFGLRSPAQ